MKSRLLLSFVLSFSLMTCGAVCRPLNVSQTFTDGEMGDFTAFSLSGSSRVWHTNGNYGVVVSAWNSGYQEDDWLVSPEYDFTGMKSFTLTFEHCLYRANTTDYASDVLHVYITDAYTGDVSTTQWTEMSVSQWSTSFVYATASASGWSKWTSGIRFAFRLTHDPESGNEGLYWEVRNLTLTTTCDEGAGNPGTPDTPTDRFVVRFKGHKNVWTKPYAVFTNNATQGNLQTSAMTLAGSEGDYYLWEKEVDGDALLEAFFAGNLAVAIRQASYSADYHSGSLQTLPRLLLDDGLHCFIAGNLDGEANILSDNNSYSEWDYTTQETNYSSAEGNTMGRQTGMLFDTECNDLDHHIRYASLVGKSGTALINAVSEIENRDKRVTAYMSLRAAYMVTDYSTYGNILDMYSNRSGTYKNPSGTSGNASESSSAYNREHGLPKSWWGHKDASAVPAFTDIVHVIPANGYVNEARSYFPYGEVGYASETFGNGSKVGTSSFSGYSGSVFEPIDEYKGDMARMYFYMVTCYRGMSFTNNASGRAVFTYSSGAANFTTYAKNLFLKWARQDEVSARERTRNDGVQSIQGNRNPFIDLPNLFEYIWGSKAGQPYSFDGTGTALTATDDDIDVSAWKFGNTIHIEASCSLTVEHYSIVGQRIGTYNVEANGELLIPCADGVDLIRVSDNNGRTRTFKLM